MDFATVGWTVAIAAFLALALYVGWIVWRAQRDRLMRCPETGSITLVGIEPAARGDGKAPGVEVQRCGLWPEKQDCDQGCLARHEETAPGHKVNLHALRPFKPE